MEHYALHRRSAFEGFYTRFILPSGDSLIYILCTVRRKQHYFCLTLVPKDGNKAIFQREMLLDDISSVYGRNKLEFAMIGHMPDWRISLDASYDAATRGLKIEYDANDDDGGAEMSFHATTKKPTWWSPRSRFSSPEGILAYLPLPLHWHVLSLESECELSVRLPAEAELDARDAAPLVHGVAHEEKNWSDSFPSAHMWVQARHPVSSPGKAKGICLAGGKILGMEAFLLGYRNEELGLEIDFRPPFALKCLGIAPFMSFDIDWENRRFDLSIQDFFYKVEVRGSAPKASFFSLSAPTASGFKENYMAESLRAQVDVTVWKRTFPVLGSMEKIDAVRFEQAGLEFGGEYYPLRGTAQKPS